MSNEKHRKTMIHKVVHYTKSDNCEVVFESEDQRNHIISSALDSFVKSAGRPNANYYATLQINIHSNKERVAGILAKPRAFRAAKDGEDERVGWAVAVLNPKEYDYICELPEDEVDNALVNILKLEGEPAAYWTKRY
jgi:hypothetical protein